MCLEIRQILLSLETGNTLFLVLLDAAHLRKDSVLLGLQLRLLLVLLSLREILVNALVEIAILNVQVVLVGCQQLTWNELLEDFAAELLDDIFAVHRQNLL